MSAFPHKQLRFLFSVTSGATPESGNSAFWDGDIYWATPEDVSGGAKTLSSTRRKITKEGFENCSAKMAPPGTIVLTKRAPIGQLAISNVDLCCNQGCFLLEPAPDADNHFFYYWLTIQTGYLQVLGRGSTFMELSTDEIKAIDAPCIPVAQQRQISKYLDRETGDIDTLIGAKRRLLDLLAEKRRAIVAEAIMRGLNPAAPLRPSGIDWLGDIPAHWEAIPLRFLVSLSGGATPDTRNLDYWSGAIPWVSPKDMKRDFIDDAEDHVSEAALDNSALKMIEPNAILIVVRGMILAHSFPTAINTVPVTINQDMKALRCSEKIAPAFLVDVLKGAKDYLVSLADSSAHGTKKLETEALCRFEVPVPPLAEQREIVRHIAAETAKIDRLRAATEHSITLLKERRGALIAAAVTGQIDIPEAA